MKIDFWQVTQGPIEKVVAQIAPRVIAAGDRLLVVDTDPARRAAISKALWDLDEFMANGETHPDRQPILLSAECIPVNGAKVAVLADGEWLDAGEGFARTFLLFGEAQVPAARAVWRRFDGRGDVSRSYYAQENGKWVKKG